MHLYCLILLDNVSLTPLDIFVNCLKAFWCCKHLTAAFWLLTHKNLRQRCKKQLPCILPKVFIYNPIFPYKFSLTFKTVPVSACPYFVRRITFQEALVRSVVIISPSIVLLETFFGATSSPPALLQSFISLLSSTICSAT